MSSREIIFSAAGAAGAPATYIEDVFSTYLYTGNDSTQTITNGIDLAGKGGIVWTKGRSTARDNNIVDTVRGGDNMLYTNQTIAQFSLSGLGFSSFSFGSSGYTASNAPVDAENGATFVSWTFRKQPKFFDIVTYTGNGVDGRSITHNLGSTPGMIIVKCTSSSTNWPVVHRSGDNLALNLTAVSGPTVWAGGTLGFNNSTTFETYAYAGSQAAVNASGQTYVAYLFAHNAGGFGATGTDNVISCGSYTGNGSNTGPTITLGYEPQYVLIKSATSAQGWWIFDSMRGGLSLVGYTALTANTSNAEVASSLVQLVGANATGFQLTNSTPVTNASGQTYIYMAIRRGPMATPTSGTQVYASDTFGGTAPNPPGFNGVLTDLAFYKNITGSFPWAWGSRLQGAEDLDSASTRAAASDSAMTFDYQDGFYNSSTVQSNVRAWMFRRAPSFMDVVCYTGTGASRTLTHNLTVAPELIIIKSRSGAYSWSIGSLFTSSNFVYNTLETTDAGQTFTYAAGVVFNGQPSASSVFLNSSGGTNGSGDTFVMYLFATIAGVSKVGSYTGTGSTQTINAGLPTGARFVLIKRTDSTGDWWVWDTARGMVAGTDPRLALNSTAAQTNANWVYTVTNGFQIVTSDATVNASGGSYIYLAIA